MPNSIDPADLQRYRELQTIIEAATSELNGIKAKWRELPAGKYDDVTVSQVTRFDADLALAWITTNQPDLLPLVQETVISQAKIKQVIPKAIYDTQMVTTGAPMIRVK